MAVWVCASSETIWFPTLIGQKQGSLCVYGAQTGKFALQNGELSHPEPRPGLFSFRFFVQFGCSKPGKCGLVKFSVPKILHTQKNNLLFF